MSAFLVLDGQFFTKMFEFLCVPLLLDLHLAFKQRLRLESKPLL